MSRWNMFQISFQSNHCTEAQLQEWLIAGFPYTEKFEYGVKCRDGDYRCCVIISTDWNTYPLTITLGGMQGSHWESEVEYLWDCSYARTIAEDFFCLLERHGLPVKLDFDCFMTNPFNFLTT